MTAIGPGDFVECVDAEPGKAMLPTLLTKGALYRIGEVFTNEWGDVGVTLVGMDPSPNPGWMADRFRPIYRPRADLIERLLQPIDETTPEQVPA